MTTVLQQLFNALALGGVYALVALGLTLVYGVMKIPNFAHGGLYMLGAYLSYAGISSLGLGYVPALLLSAVVVALLAALMERVIFFPLRNAPHVQPMIAALGVLFFLEAGVQLIWGADFKQVAEPIPGILNIGGVTITWQRLIVLVASVVAMLGLNFFLRRTLTGATIEAMAQNREGARLVGINTGRVGMLTFAISGALAAIGASLIAPIVSVTPAMGEIMNLKVFAIIILGGMGSIPGAIVGAFLLAFAEVFGGYINLDFAEVIGFAVLVVVLAIRPQGLFRRAA
ncbi:branched-chain amino acid ABC transporter permease [Deinococcus radiodurans]|uniref:Branched-chain amino acid ABC transporter, permease protein n=1 Tax=Deinococcus radiodurans (strain ATCC 13939 / DSM 20539 / JCM 16871 / CCUG 27074 / LMG 4051 / NBRC 15346 / NCIMB 9279 / VKM B-1422 / R1) TaxID=243230 RepID=Q9RXM9_DEIRA|nr:branched-chain amino acid ABC transporter permease [Deinococcus radiodurans]AAF09863.1 branched-chain amino acid ABC transporter, permease protein [Deinococcus radiodurans R1 = ATCC 13939 = DSM 20539]ANC72458.1 ABC transporter permease [Deinococcus radiodurans R1 = ATCC 13939 = DSM 20539]QEM72244.1 branched-chain amino acid ABC transporter permease [Deinococcus radiodurans]QIP28488.1 branched-chain amino acid ABC transporter permease [Deinococcus radiodurans]QIP32795.1 branched-chain amino 